MIPRAADAPTNFYPRPPRGGRHIFRQSLAYLIPISIHALREEGDPSHPPHLPLPAISIHALREEGDPSFFDRRYHNGRFLSTPSARRATKLPPRKRSSQKNFYPRPPRGGRLSTKGIPAAAFRFLSTPSARRATSAAGTEGLTVAFLSTPSARRATSATPRTSRSRCHFYPRPPRGGRLAEYAFAKHLPEISIHALREEGDPAFQFAGLRYLKFLSTPSARRATSSRARPCSIPCYFYPRPPRGGRRSTPRRATPAPLFLSTPSARRATFCLPRRLCRRCYFYPRPPRGGRPASVGHADAVSRFLSTPSARRATTEVRCPLREFSISIHALREEGDRTQRQFRRSKGISIHALREEGDERSAEALMSTSLFLSTPSARRATVYVELGTGIFAEFLSTPSARRATEVAQTVLPIISISIHALREEGDKELTSARFWRILFLSTPSARRATGHQSLHL